MKNITLFILLLVTSQFSLAQNKKFDFTFDHYSINILDLDRSVAFYQKYFFVEEIHNGTEKDNIRWFSLGNNQSLHMSMNKDMDIKIPKGVHMAVTTADLDGYIKFLKKNKVEYFDWPGASMQISTRPDKVRQIYIQDPDGYWIEINTNILQSKK